MQVVRRDLVWSWTEAELTCMCWKRAHSPQGRVSILSWCSHFFLCILLPCLFPIPAAGVILKHLCCWFFLWTLQWTVMNLWSCLAPEGQSDRRDFTKSLMLWFVFSNKAASLISILADLWETARAMELAYWRWVFIQNTFPMPRVTA